MATGMQTGKRTGVSALRTGPAPTAGGGPLKGITKKWNDLDPKMKTVVMISAAVLVVAIIIGNAVISGNKPVPLFPTNINSADASEIQQMLAQWGIPYSIEPGGTNVLVPPQYKHRALLQLASAGLPRRKVTPTVELIGDKNKGMTPDTQQDKERKMLLALESDLIITIRQIEGIADAYVKIVPQKDDFGENKTSASASVLLRLQPGSKLSPSQVKAISLLVTSSVAGLEEDNVKIVDTSGRLLNGKLGDDVMNAGEGEGRFTTRNIEERRAIEEDLQRKVETALDDIVGPGRSKVRVSVEMDFSQSETKSTKVGGPGNVTGTVDIGVQEDTETFKSGSGANSDTGINEISGTAAGANDYQKKKVVIRREADKTVKVVVNKDPRIKRISCSVMLDGVKDPGMLAKVENFTKNAIGIDVTRGDTIAVESYPFTYMLEEIKNQPVDVAGAPPLPGQRSSMPSWLPMALAIPIVMMIMLVGLFYMKQKSVQKEKQRLVLNAGPGATVSDISDLLADKEGKITTPPATRVNTTDQLENLAKEKPTKVAELLKSTWLADR